MIDNHMLVVVAEIDIESAAVEPAVELVSPHILVGDGAAPAAGTTAAVGVFAGSPLVVGVSAPASAPAAF